MKLAIILAALSLAACTRPVPIVPVPVAPPALPEALAADPGPLPPIAATDLHSTLKDGLEADRRYREVRMTNRALVTLYGCVREAIVEATDPRRCLDPK